MKHENRRVSLAPPRTRVIENQESNQKKKERERESERKRTYLSQHFKVYCAAYAVSDITAYCCIGTDIVLCICMLYRVTAAQNLIVNETDYFRDDFDEHYRNSVLCAFAILWLF